MSLAAGLKTSVFLQSESRSSVNTATCRQPVVLSTFIGCFSVTARMIDFLFPNWENYLRTLTTTPFTSNSHSGRYPIYTVCLIRLAISPSVRRVWQMREPPSKPSQRGRLTSRLFIEGFIIPEHFGRFRRARSVPFEWIWRAWAALFERIRRARKAWAPKGRAQKARASSRDGWRRFW